MDREIVDSLLTGMLQSAEGISDLLFISGKPPLVETHGRLNKFSFDGPGSVLTPLFIEQLAGHIINGSERLKMEFAVSGSGDCSYAIENLARFRVNIFKQNGRHAVEMRKLQSEVPTLDKLGLPPVFREIVKEEKRDHSRHRRNGDRQNHYPGRDGERTESHSGDPHRNARGSDRILSLPQKSRDQSA
jgi:twitching motility protein PilT